MPFRITRLRRWLAFAAIAVSLVVAGVYFHRRRQATDVLKTVPGKIGLNIQQTAEGFKVSKSEQGRTLFTIQASKAVQFKLGGRAELHNVTITLYGRDSSRYDQIYGDNFSYDPQSGDVLAKGEVRIDLEANPEGLLKPDQSVPTALKNPVHLTTRDLVFNQKTGDAFTDAKVDLNMPQIAGSAVGLHYAAKDNALTLNSSIDLTLHGQASVHLVAAQGLISKEPRQVVLDRPRVTHGSAHMEATKATLYLRPDNTVDHVIATDSVQAEFTGNSSLRARAGQAKFVLNDAQDGLSNAVFEGNVSVEATGAHPAQADAGRIDVSFASRNRVSRVHASNHVKLIELPSSTPTAGSSNSQRTEVTAPAIDFYLAKGKHLERAETSAGGQIEILPSANAGTRTVVTAGRFNARFDDANHLQGLHGTPEAKIVSSTPGQPDRVSTSQTVDVAFRAAGGIESIVQQGDFVYSDSERQARGEKAKYIPANEIIELTGSPRVTDKGLSTTAQVVRMNRASGDATAEGNVKSTYNDLREQPNGALLASASPIHITARNMVVHRTSAIATYSGDARIWQDANVVEAPSIQFDRDHRSVVAEGDGKPVSTALVQMNRDGSATPVAITSKRLTYTDDQHRVHFESGVVVRGSDVTITSDHVDAYMVPRSQATGARSVKGQGQLDHIIAEGDVVVEQLARRAEGDKLVYTASDDEFVLTGKSPSIFDAEHGKITANSLTFYKRDDRVLVEGRDNSPSVTQTRVAR
jgi:lipopolysaccharide export system protein LptA